MARWTLDLNKYAEKQENKILEIRKSFLFALYNSITFRTPIDTGRARGNWNVSVNSADGATNENSKSPKYTSVSQMPNNRGDEPLFISNGLDYIERLEYGYSKQAPNGMVGVTVSSADDTLEEIVRANR